MKAMSNGYFSLETKDYADSMREHLKIELASTLNSILKEIRYQASTYYETSLVIDKKSNFHNLKAIPLLKAANQSSLGIKVPNENEELNLPGVYIHNLKVYNELESIMEKLGYTLFFYNNTITIYW